MKFKKLISSSLAIGLLLNNTSISLASILSEDGRYETFEDSNIIINNVLEEDKVDVEIEGNTLVNLSSTKEKTPITLSKKNNGNEIISLSEDRYIRPIIEGSTLLVNKNGEEVELGTEGAILKSSFEDKLVESSRYKVRYLTIGESVLDYDILKNDEKIQSPHFSDISIISTPIKVFPNTTYRATSNCLNGPYSNIFLLKDINEVPSSGTNGLSLSTKYITTNEDGYLWVAVRNNTVNYDDFINGLYYASLIPRDVKDLYLSSPLLENDTIEEINNKIFHIKRSEQVPYTNGDEVDYITDYNTTIKPLDNPIYELISTGNLLLNSYLSGYLELDTSIPVNTVTFLSFEEELAYLYSNEKYILQFESDNSGMIDINLGGTKLTNKSIIKGLNKIQITTPLNLENTKLILNGSNINISNIVVCNNINEKFDYFEGIKSVGQNDNGSHKIEILSQNENLNYVGTKKGVLNGQNGYEEYGKVHRFISKDFIEVLPNTSYAGNYKYDNIFEKNADINVYFYDENKNFIETKRTGLFVTPSDCKYIKLCSHRACNSEAETDFMLVKGNKKATRYIQGELNKKEILLNEPLRSVGDVEDRIIKRNGQWVVERNIKEIILNGNEKWDDSTSIVDESNLICWYNLPDGKVFTNTKSDMFSTSFIKGGTNIEWSKESIFSGNAISGQPGRIALSINKSKLLSNDIQGLKKWLKENPVTVVYQLATPTYEPLNIDFTINTYLDITHISNNSNIPANMKVTIDRTINRATESIELAKTNPTVANISNARYWSNLLKESLKKDQLQNEVNSITNIDDLQLERKSASSNLDVYVKSQNMLSLSLSTNSITFDNYSGTEDTEKLGAVNISINSSLPYSLNAYMPTEISNSDKSETLPIDILNIRNSGETVYQTFDNTTDKVVLKDSCNAGNNLMHNIDLKLSSNLAHKADVYKTVIKFEAEQK